MHRSATPHTVDAARDRLGPALLCRPVGQQAFWAREIDGRGAGSVGHLESPPRGPKYEGRRSQRTSNSAKKNISITTMLLTIVKPRNIALVEGTFISRMPDANAIVQCRTETLLI